MPEAPRYYKDMKGKEWDLKRVYDKEELALMFELGSKITQEIPDPPKDGGVPSIHYIEMPVGDSKAAGFQVKWQNGEDVILYSETVDGDDVFMSSWDIEDGFPLSSCDFLTARYKLHLYLSKIDYSMID